MNMGNNDAIDRRGLWTAVAAFVLWGLMPLYWHLLKPVSSLQIVLHRVLWGALLVAAWLTFKYGRGWLRDTLAQPRAAAMLAVSGTLIAFNWACTSGRSTPGTWSRPAWATSSTRC